MVTDFIPPLDEALYSFIQHLKGTSRADKTVRFYQTQLTTLFPWISSANAVWMSTSSGDRKAGTLLRAKP